MDEVDFSKYEKPKEEEQKEMLPAQKAILENPKFQENVSIKNVIPTTHERKKKVSINFQQMPEDSREILKPNETKEIVDKYIREEAIPIPRESPNSNSYLSLVLSPNLIELELMIRGLEYVKRYNPITGKDEVLLRKIPNHPLNEYGINSIMEQLKVYCSPEIKLGRKRTKDYYNSVQHVCHSIVRLIYKNLKAFGMDTQMKQRKAKVLSNAIIEFVDAAYSRSVEGKENDLSRATEFRIEGNIDTLNDPAKMFISKDKKEALKN